MHDFNKPHPHVENPEETTKKRKLPVYILVIVGIFLAALIVYMLADNSAKPVAQAVFTHTQSILLAA